jgi:predicted signal transduction protein with EAL and GGDEF domain
VSIVTEGLTGDAAESPGSRAGVLAGLELHQVVDVLHEGVAALDATGSVLEASDTFRDLVGGADRVSRLVDPHGRPVVAEGIEVEDQRRMLSRLGCSYGQGYLLGRPGRIDLTPHERAAT